MYPFIILGAVVILVVVVVAAVLWEDRRGRDGKRPVRAEHYPWRSRRRAVAATLEVATPHRRPPRHG